MRSASADDALNLTPVRKMTLEDALEYIGDDELVEITPSSIQLRKRSSSAACESRYALSRLLVTVVANLDLAVLVS